MSQILDRIIEGGPVFMVPILLILLASIVLTILAALGKRDTAKTRELIGHISLFAMIWGLLGSTIGLIVAFDAISAINDVETPAVAAPRPTTSCFFLLAGFPVSPTFLSGV